MKARTYRPKVQNGTVVKRRTRAGGQKSPTRPARSKSTKTAAGRRKISSRKTAEKSGGARVLWMLILAGAIVATGFIYALRAQINIHQLGQMESALKDELDEIANRQRYQIFEQQRAVSPQQIDNAARQAGLVQPGLVRTRNQVKPPVQNR